MNSYKNFGIMILCSAVLMFVVMYFNTYELSHVFFSQTRAYMTVLMASVMAVVMLAFMLDMYKNPKMNSGIFLGSAVAFILALWLVRSQITVGDVSWMKAMIPHHSIAILTSERAQITDPRVRKLADQIIEAQKREIGEMKDLIKDIEAKR